MTVDAEDECPFCHASLVYVDKVDAPREHIVLGKYFWLYFAKHTWFAVVCAAIWLYRAFSVKPEWTKIPICMAVFGMLSLLISIFERRFARSLQWKYTQEYAINKTALWKYLFGSIAVLLSFFI